MTGAGEVLVTLTVELDNKQVSYFRKNSSIWDLLAFTGGFCVTLMFLGKICYNLLSMNSSDRLQGAYMMSQYHTRNRSVNK